ncbi:autotransporter adhesin [Bartonella chomelii]|uniref:Autotransporter adhesin n=1 Tax=Bartonella chomelii TaxID=236402 RepID=A0ABR6E252_9HYPH|nr:YadA-like family protein [Bartonella chomelii]MBA9082645.1 autotransporter adhesin [Bartonella chomelii]
MKKVYITPKNKGLNYQKFFSELPIVKAVSLGAVMAGLLSSVSPIFASHLSSTGLTVQSISTGVVSANVAHGRIGGANGDRSCGADASVNALMSASACSSVDVDGATNDWFLEENNTINGFANTRSVNTVGTGVASRQTRGVSFRGDRSYWCQDNGSQQGGICLGLRTGVYVQAGVALREDSVARRGSGHFVFNPSITSLLFEDEVPTWQATLADIAVGNFKTGKTRQVTGVAAGSEDTDAVNITQLKALQKWVEKGHGGAGGRGGSDLVIRQDSRDLISLTVGDVILIGNERGGDVVKFFNKNGGERFLLGVKGGTIGRGSTDAINGSQLFETNTMVAKYLGGGTKYEGKWTEPTFTIQRKLVHDVGDAFASVDAKLTELFQQVGSAGGDGLVKQDGSSHIITIGKEAKGNEISITGSDGSRKLTGLKNGDVSDKSTDAINGSQLYEQGSRISQYLGGGANVLKNEAPVYTIQGQGHSGVEAAFAGVDKKLTELSKQVGSAGGDSLVKQEESNVITIGKEAKGNEISITGSEGSRKLTGLKNGDISGSSTDAVTGAQLNETNTTVAKYLGGKAAYEGGKWTEPTFTITDFGAQSKNGEQQYHNVTAAFDAVNNSMSGLNDRIKKVEQQTGSSVNSNSLNWDDGKNAYDASHSGQAGKITNVANGEIEKGSTDVVTGHQLWAMNEEIDSLKDKVDNIMINGGGTLTTEGVVTYDKDKPNTITLAGTDDDTPVLIDNVADGEIEEGSKQAVNGGQLKEQMGVVLADANKYTDEKIGNMVNDAVVQANAYTDMKFEALNYRVESVQKEARQAAAIGLAVANLHYIETPGMLSVAFGSGVWRGQSALAFGAGYMSEDGKMRSNFSVTTSGGHWGIGAGLSLALK